MTRTHLQHSILTAVLVLVLVLPATALAATRYVADTGTDGPFCGHTAAAACRSISQAITLAAVGDTILVAPGRYGDLNGNGIISEAGEETGAPGCGCVIAINKNVIIVSSAGAAVTVIDGRRVDVATNVLLITNGGEFGRPGKGFTVTKTKAATSYGIALDSANVQVRGNMVHASQTGRGTVGILTVNDAPVRIEGNQVTNWATGISSRGAATVSKNLVVGNETGIDARGGSVAGNVAIDNAFGIALAGTVKATGNAAYLNYLLQLVVAADFTGTVTKNNMFGQVCGFTNLGPSQVEAANNYWGAPTGSGPLPAGDTCGPGPTITSPFATTPFVVKILKP